MPFENPLRKRPENDTTPTGTPKESGMVNPSPLTGVYRQEEDIGEANRGKAFKLPPYVHVKKPRKPLAEKPAKKAEQQKGHYDQPKPDAVKFQEDLNRRFP